MHITPQQPVETGIPSNRRDNLKQICIPAAGTVPLVQTACRCSRSNANRPPLA